MLDCGYSRAPSVPLGLKSCSNSSWEVASSFIDEPYPLVATHLAQSFPRFIAPPPFTFLFEELVVLNSNSSSECAAWIVYYFCHLNSNTCVVAASYYQYCLPSSNFFVSFRQTKGSLCHHLFDPWVWIGHCFCQKWEAGSICYGHTLWASSHAALARMTEWTTSYWFEQQCIGSSHWLDDSSSASSYCSFRDLHLA